MNDRRQRIDSFLKFFRDISLQNPGLTINEKMVYGELTQLGIPESENRALINNNFQSWIDHFKYNPNCDVFVSENWKYFCQFISADGLARNAEEHIKIYVPLDSQHIERGAVEIFEFLSNKGITHLSKIGSHVRFDDIVIRLVNPNDVPVLINFLNSNKFIQEGLLPANPFAFSVDGIPMACDGSLSFNSTVANLIVLYFENKKVTNTLNMVSVNDFYGYVVNYYNMVFRDANGIEKLARDFDISSNDIGLIVNYRNVFDLILKCNNKNFNFENYISHYKECSDNYIQMKKEKEIQKIKNGNYQYNTHSNKEEVSFQSVQDLDKMMFYIIDTMMEKYPDQYSVLLNINNYLNTGVASNITRHNNLRDYVVNSNFRYDLNIFLKQNKINFVDYAQERIRERSRNESIDLNSYSTMEKNVIAISQEILSIMGSKYGEYEAQENFIEYIKTGEPHYLTREANLRERVANSTFRRDIKEVLRERKLDITQLLEITRMKSITSQEVILETAILETYNKYENKFQEETSRYSGVYMATSALNQLLINKQYNGFTRDNGARQVLMDNVSIDEVIEIMKNTLGITELNVSQQDIKNYIQIVVENNLKKSR